MDSRYDDAHAAQFVGELRQRHAELSDDLALRVYTSRLLGAEPALVLHGGGNTSLKSSAREITGEPVDVLYVKGSGWDLGSIGPAGFPACRLAPLRRALELTTLSDEAMVQLLRSQMLDPSSPTPSVEALLHARLPGKYVDHTHADAVLAVIDQPDSRARALDVWGERHVFVPYVMPGFVLGRTIAALDVDWNGRHVMVLDKHGIFTWGSTARESYERMIEAVTAAERYVADRRRSVAPVAASVALDDAARRRRQRALAPLVRGAVARAPGGDRFVLRWRDEPEILSLLGRPDAAELCRIGPITPDHVIRTKPVPAWLADASGGDADAPAVDRALEEFGRAYDAYVARSAASRQRSVAPLDRIPRVLAVPGLGALTLGKTARDADVVGDLTLHTATVIESARAIGTYRPVSELDLFDVEYWSLEQAKLGKGSAPAPFERRIALVTGAAAGIGRATAELFLGLGAHVLLVDRDAERLERVRLELARRFGPAVSAAVADLTDPAAAERAVDAAVDAYGGLDVVVSNAGTAPSGKLHEADGEAALLASLEVNLTSHQRVARQATRVLLAQRLGGSLSFNASKSAFNQGPEFGPYAIPKTALVALMRQYAVDLGAFSIRSNAVNADRIRTDLFGGGVLEARAKARGVSPDEYFRQNLLHRETTALDVARAFAWLASAEATTGCVVTVDGGNPAAFPR